MRFRLGVSLLLLLCLCTLASAADKIERVKDKYKVLQLSAAEVQPEAPVPPEYIPLFQKALFEHEVRAKLFEEIVEPGASPNDASKPALRLGVVITKYVPGSRAKRYFGGANFGNAEIHGTVTFTDAVTGRKLWQEKVHSYLGGGIFGGSSKSVNDQFAHDVFLSTNYAMLQPLPGPQSAVVNAAKESIPESVTTSSPAATDAAVAAAAPAVVPAIASASNLPRQTLILSKDTYDVVQKQLNEHGANGFHVVEISPEQNRNSTLIMEKSDDLSREYVVIHGLWIPNLNKRIAQSAQAGYRVVPNSLTACGSDVVLLMERSPESNTIYTYKFHQEAFTSIEKSAKKDAEEGYTPAASYRFKQARLMIVEKPVGERK